jgi:hypothetical protein
MLIVTVLILHGFLAIVLLGAISHQAFALTGSGARGTLSARFRSVDPSGYTNTIVILFVTTSLLGAVLYPEYRLTVRPVLENFDLRTANGAFEIKEQFTVLGLLMLPAYWSSWKRVANAEYALLRRTLTWLIAFFVWWSFFVGHVLNNIQGLSPWTA